MEVLRFPRFGGEILCRDLSFGAKSIEGSDLPVIWEILLSNSVF